MSLISHRAAKLEINKDNIRITTLMPRSVKADEVMFMQYRISVPGTAYSSIKSQTWWPSGVRVRDFIFKRANNSKTTSCPVDKSQFVIASNDIEKDLPFPSRFANQDSNHAITNEDFTEPPTNAAMTLQDSNMDQMD